MKSSFIILATVALSVSGGVIPPGIYVQSVRDLEGGLGGQAPLQVVNADYGVYNKSGLNAGLIARNRAVSIRQYHLQYFISGLGDTSAQSFDTITGAVTALTPVPLAMHGGCGARLGESLMVCGGTPNLTAPLERPCLKYENAKWTPMTVNATSDNCEMFNIGHRIFYVGGADQNNLLEYDETHMKWITLAALPMSMQGAGVVHMHRDTVMMCGGVGENNTVTNECYTYDAATDKFTQMASLNYAKRDHGLVDYHGRILAIGGFGPDPITNKFGVVLDIEVYDAQTSAWNVLPYKLIWFTDRAGIFTVEQ